MTILQKIDVHLGRFRPMHDICWSLIHNNQVKLTREKRSAIPSAIPSAWWGWSARNRSEFRLSWRLETGQICVIHSWRDKSGLTMNFFSFELGNFMSRLLTLGEDSGPRIFFDRDITFVSDDKRLSRQRCLYQHCMRPCINASGHPDFRGRTRQQERKLP